MWETISILIAEDDAITGQFLENLMLAFGFGKIYRVISGKEAIRVALEKKPGLIIMDIVLHDDITGIEAADFILSQYHAPVIFLTANFSEESLHKSIDIGAYAFVIKPVNKNQLFSAVSIALKKYETEKQILELNNQLLLEIKKREEFEKQLQQSEKLLHFAIEQMPVPVIIVNAADYRVYKINSAALLLLSALPKNIHDLFLDDYMKYLPTFSRENIPMRIENLPLVRALKYGEISKDMEIIIKKNNKKKWFMAQAAPLFNDSGEIIAGIMVLFEITDRIMTLEKLKSSEDTARGILNATTSPVILISASGLVLDLNKAAMQCFSIDREGLLGKHLAHYSLGISDNVNEHINQIKKEKYQFAYERKIGDVLYIISFFPILDDQGKVMKIAIYFMDITEKRNLEKEIMKISERERRLIGQDIHDDLGQKLTAVTFLAEALKGSMRDHACPGIRDMDEIIHLVKDIIVHAKKLSKGLCPVQLGPGGIFPALKELQEETEKIFNVKCSLEMGDEIFFENTETSINIYHIVQECINNAIKHAAASEIAVSFSKDDAKFFLTIENNINDSFSEQMARKGMGTEIMKYRATIIGADLQVVAADNRYIVRVSLPVTSR